MRRTLPVMCALALTACAAHRKARHTYLPACAGRTGHDQSHDQTVLLRLRGSGIVYEQTLNFSALQAAWPNASIYSCAKCGAHISMTSFVVSKKFQGQSRCALQPPLPARPDTPDCCA